MIISRQKEFKDIIKSIGQASIFIIGCGKCASKQHVGGEPEVLEMKKKLGRSGKKVVGWTVLSSACNITSWDDVVSENPDMAKAEAFLVMSCGAGATVISDGARQRVYPALDTESLGGVFRDEVVRELCGMCGECDIQVFGGICPVGQCPKSMLNGPCGGAMDGKCEVDERKCIWDKINERLKSIGRPDSLSQVHGPKDHSKRRRRD